ncbi:hypothetical protein FZC66_16555 [Priestia megaterium]|nr:hypothetical protein FZC66_16555 [Priestia megaterium]
MTLESLLIQKEYYGTFISEDEVAHPIQVLGAAFLEEQNKELYDLSSIRLAQGEIYYHNKDFEAAIFKWENVNGELELWAKKNIADAYYELGLLSIAEEIYVSIETECKTLTSEVGLQLFSLYKEQKNINRAYEVIKELVSFNPNYPNVTTFARAFYEDQQDWRSAVELAVDESIRTESFTWFDILKRYVSKGYTKSFAPNYFYQVLITFYKVDQLHFKQIVASLWTSYKNEKSYLAWVKTINDIFLNVEVGLYDYWQEISGLYQETYGELINGQYFMEELHSVIPNLLTNWLKLTNNARSLFPAAAVLAWNKQFTSSIDRSTISDAEALLFDSSSDINGLAYCLDLCESITKWGNEHGLEVGDKFNWLAHSLSDTKTNYLLIAGSSQSGKSSFINSILGENVAGGTDLPVVIFHDDEFEVTKRSSYETKTSNELASLENMKASDQEACIELRMPNPFLKQTECAFIDIPGFLGNTAEKNEVFEYLPLADGLLFVLDAGKPFTDKEQASLIEIKEYMPHVPVHFLLNKMDKINSEEEVARTTQEVQAKIKQYFPDAQILPYSSEYAVSEQLSDATRFVHENFHFSHKQFKNEEKAAKLLVFIRKTLSNLLRQRAKMKNDLINATKWNEDMVVRLNGFIHTLQDTESEKTKELSKSYHAIKEKMKKQLAEELPNILRHCSELIHENSDFRNIHVELNQKMNERMQEYVEQQLLPSFRSSLQEWVAMCKEQFTESQTYIEEIAETFNNMYEEERLKLQCDFKVLDDWKRDVNRMTSRIQLEEENILLRVNPTQILLKSAGKLFGSLTQNQTILYNQYKKYIENEHYEDVTASVSNKFFLQFDLFEKSLEVDINMFFEQPITMLNETVDASHREIANNQESLDEMEKNAQAYADPLSLFELRLYQYELMMQAKEDKAQRNTELKEEEQVIE